MTTPLRVLLVDDEPLARQRLRTLLADCTDVPTQVVGEAGDAEQALRLLPATTPELLLLDIRLPGIDGLQLAQRVRALQPMPAVVFVTAHAEHALQAFDLAAADYLTKPVRLPRLREALQKVEQLRQSARALQADSSDDVVVIQERNRTLRVPLSEVVYFKAELKYLTVRTAQHSYILEGALSDLETRHAAQFVRVHRNALVARRALRALHRQAEGEDGESWMLQLDGVPELVTVSRRQLPLVRELLER